ncbi:MAG TPA: hypothetical protein VKV39_00055 [Candidatus Sulfotelmatobacter sp.]|nr:hypothetical protein [Candidatus Sulfotelmatobacter sp.]
MTSPRTRQSFLALAVLLTMTAPFALAGEPTGWLEIHSSHFTVFTDAGEKKGREVALRFEQMRAVFANLLTRDHLNQPVPLTILAFNNDKSYYQLAPLHQGQPIEVPGFLLSGDDQDFIALNLSEEEPWRAVAHDFAQMLLHFNYPPGQAWFDEGLAEYFASVRVDNRQVELGGDPELGSSGKSLTELLNSETWLPLPELFATKLEAAKTKDGSRHTLFYAESWMVMHYLIHEKKLPDTGNYFDLVLNQHLPEEDAIQKAYGMSSAQLETAVQQYFHSLAALQTALEASRQKGANARAPQPYQSGALVGPDDSAIISKPYPEADARALYAGVQVRIPERREVGLAQLKKLATTPTPADVKTAAKNEAMEKRDTGEDTLPTSAVGNALAHRNLAWDEIQHDEFDDALVELGDAAALNQRDMWVRYYLSVLKYRMAQAKHSDIAGLPNMMLDLRAVLEWYPEFANAYDLLAVARNEGGSTATAMQSERAAMTLSPREDMYSYHLALIYISSKKWEAAKDRLERLKTSSDPQIVKLASDRLDELANQRKYGMAAIGASQPQFAPQKSPFDVLEEDAAKRAAAEKQDQARGADQRPTKFLKGRLVGIDCSEAPAAVLTVTAEGIVLKLRAVDYKALLLIGADDFSCDWRNRQVTVNYKPGGTSDGDIVSLEMR